VGISVQQITTIEQDVVLNQTVKKRKKLDKEDYIQNGITTNIVGKETKKEMHL
jgi:glycogen synthase